jgi:hypothetical protein
MYYKRIIENDNIMTGTISTTRQPDQTRTSAVLPLLHPAAELSQDKHDTTAAAKTTTTTMDATYTRGGDTDSISSSSSYWMLSDCFDTVIYDLYSTHTTCLAL